ncbi:hypothetical protein JAAARDRAFT_201659 [Jaapia argillacea MUCL 33604]|uniref:DUF6697 domain-containing protein n=1 Tax=Jaapia argillacea MUCL 33604 TaxID=933084 RepID=A0A067QB57_9AGAM|nr:hypothetical protein JAAARDRAFT_201659 [Jaapia argillacea MUCL 33604]
MSLMLDALVLVTVGVVVEFAWTGLDAPENRAALQAPRSLDAARPPTSIHHDDATNSSSLSPSTPQAVIGDLPGVLADNPIIGTGGNLLDLPSVPLSVSLETLATSGTPQTQPITVLASQEGEDQVGFDSLTADLASAADPPVVDPCMTIQSLSIPEPQASCPQNIASPAYPLSTASEPAEISSTSALPMTHLLPGPSTTPQAEFIAHGSISPVLSQVMDYQDTTCAPACDIYSGGDTSVETFFDDNDGLVDRLDFSSDSKCIDEPSIQYNLLDQPSQVIPLPSFCPFLSPNTDGPSCGAKRKRSTMVEDIKPESNSKRMKFVSLRKSAAKFVKKLVGSTHQVEERLIASKPIASSPAETILVPSHPEAAVPIGNTSKRHPINSRSASNNLPPKAKRRALTRVIRYLAFFRSPSGSTAIYDYTTRSIRRKLYRGEYLPPAPREDGRIISAGHKAICGRGLLALIREKGGEGGIPIYYGDYYSEVDGRLSGDEFMQLEYEHKESLAREVLVGSDEEYASIRSRIASNATCSVTSLTVGDVLAAFEGGEEQVYVLAMKFKRFDYDFQESLLRGVGG